MMPGFSVRISQETFIKSTPPRMLQNKHKFNSSEHMQSFTELCKPHPARRNCLLCTVIQPPGCYVNAGAPEASSKWFEVIAHAGCFMTTALCGSCTVVSSDHP